MKIMASDVRFNTTQHEHSNERYDRQSITLGRQLAGDSNAVINQIDFSYSARMRAEDRTHVDANSSVTQGYNRSTFNKTQATHSVTQTVVGIDATVLNVAVNENSPTLLAPNKSGVYKNVEQLSLTDQQQTHARVEIREQYHYSEQQKLHVGTQGRVTTEDGREIDFMLKLEMSRDYSIEESVRTQSSERALIDPLVINLSGGAASLTSHSFSFDLNADGENEDISFVGSGSGFLAIDNNNDGRINDGSELFGTRGKDGFSDLAQYDNDNNKWIDENDEIFSKLKVWTKDAEGNDQLVDLKTAGVGAIYLGSAAASFDLRDNENNLLGQVKRSGMFLTERGEVASIQELDIAVRQKNPQGVGHKNNVENQLDAWFAEEAEQNNALLEINDGFVFDVNNPPPVNNSFEEDENKPATLLDILFPPPGTEYNYQTKKHESVEQVSETTRWESGSESDEEVNEIPVWVSRHSEDSLIELNTKTQEKIEQQTEVFSNLKAIIESLDKQHTQQLKKSETAS